MHVDRQNQTIAYDMKSVDTSIRTTIAVKRGINDKHILSRIRDVRPRSKRLFSVPYLMLMNPLDDMLPKTQNDMALADTEK